MDHVHRATCHRLLIFWPCPFSTFLSLSLNLRCSIVSKSFILHVQHVAGKELVDNNRTFRYSTAVRSFCALSIQSTVLAHAMTISKKDEVDVYLYLIAEFIVKKYATLDSILLWFAFLAFLNCDILRDINAAYDNNFNDFSVDLRTRQSLGSQEYPL